MDRWIERPTSKKCSSGLGYHAVFALTHCVNTAGGIFFWQRLTTEQQRPWWTQTIMGIQLNCPVPSSQSQPLVKDCQFGVSPVNYSDSDSDSELHRVKTCFLHTTEVYQHLYFCCLDSMSLVMRKPAFCICENKDADQLRGNREADQRLCFRYIDSTIPLLSKSEISSL